MFTIKEILEATGGRLIQGKLNTKVSGVSIDSRTIKPNELFVAIKGTRFDGHNFIVQAKFRHAGALLLSNNNCSRQFSQTQQQSNLIPIVEVDDSIHALGALANFHRLKFKIPIVAITGSNGKTTTKEMLCAILEKRFNVLRNPGTQNNHIGVPLTIFELNQRHDVGVIEIGANHLGEVSRLSQIIQPTIGIITNIGPAHLEFFKSLQGVFAAKLELVKHLARDGTLIINKDDRFLSRLDNSNFSLITFGFSRFSNFYGQIIKQTEKETTFLLNRNQRIVLKAIGRHNVYNALASIATARILGASYDEIKGALSLFQVPSMRMQLLNINNITIINDCYNSNPQSLKCALDFLVQHSCPGRKIVVCGDMLELGKQAKKRHLIMGKKIAKRKIDCLITVGPLSREIAKGASLAGMSKESIQVCNHTAVAAKVLHRLTKPKDFVLIKGSRIMQMEKVITCFTKFSTP
jgi:UDP-N-acetylmuramoyl-tripeptide--D-alanyl-D-alanine ligase